MMQWFLTFLLLLLGATPAQATKYFSVANGQILDPNGKAWRGLGIGIYDYQTTSNGEALAQDILKKFPGLNLIRMANYEYGAPAKYAPFTNYLTKRGVVVVFENHDGDHSVFTGAKLKEESKWYSDLATYYKDNPFVMFQTINEPGANCSTHQWGTYSAVRGTGSNTIVFLEAGAGGDGNPETLGDTSVYSHMQNVAWDLHAYNWMSKYSRNISVIQADQNRRIANMQAIKSADGVIPVVTLEFGNSTAVTVDVGGKEQVDATLTNPKYLAHAAWGWNNNNVANEADNLTTPGAKALTGYGKQVAAYIAKGPGQVEVNNPPSSTSTSTSTSTNTSSQPSDGSQVVDKKHNVWTIRGGRVFKNGKAVGKTSDAQSLKLYHSHILKKSSNGKWSAWNGRRWVRIPTPKSFKKR